MRSGDRTLELGMQAALGAFYAGCDVVLSPSAASDARLLELGVDVAAIGRWDRGVDVGASIRGAGSRGGSAKA